LDDTAAHAVKDAGGKITRDHGLMRAAFDENSLGFWLDILLLVETMAQALEEASVELHGYSLLLGKSLPETAAPLCRFLSGEKGGIFFDKEASEAMSPYVSVENQERWAEASNKFGMSPLSRLKTVKIFVPTARTDISLSKPNSVLTEAGQIPVTLIAGHSYEGKRDKLYLRVAGDDFSPLFVRFGGGGLNAITDSWTEWMQKGNFGAAQAGEGSRKESPSSDELYAVWEFLFHQRLRDKPTPFAIRTARRFFVLLLDSYRARAQAAGKNPVIILENIQNAEHATAGIIAESLCGRHDFVLLGTCSPEMGEADIAKWKTLFPQLEKINAEESSSHKLPDIPLDLWEFGYALSLLGQYFPPEMLPILLEEAGKSSQVISRALSLLYAHRVIDTPLDPRPWHRHFQNHAESVLGKRKDNIRALARGRLLAWVELKKIDPCLRLLEILKNLNSAAELDDNLILRALHCETTGVDGTALENIRYNRTLGVVGGPARGPVLRYILETIIALHSGNAQNIHAAFNYPLPDCSAFPLLKAQALLNQSLYFLGQRDNDSTAETVKEASLLCKGSEGGCLVQAYRLFALENLSRRRMNETAGYLGFALENAAKSGGFQDIGMAAYYAASAQLLYGNLSRAQALAEKACGHFLKAGNPEWADRSRFLAGRLAFEVGSCQNAIDIFDNIRQNPEGACSPEKIALLEAWAYRARTLGQRSPGPKPQYSGPDADLFEIEACCLAGEYSRAVELSGAFINSPGVDNFLWIERPDWRSGFAQCELLYYSWNDLRDRMLCACHSIALACLSPGSAEEAISSMQRVLRGSQFPEDDPYDVFVHYAWCRVLEQAGSGQVDISTAVSVAYKRLQSRAGRIDDSDIRRQYLTQPRWNKAIEQAAKKYKLV
jgi:hypothetical protein